ncbi:MAG: AzlD domain-containing protein [Clostridia bacterium]|nr:AzlD domain-containing protein [Clostridia bacterium]
MHNTWLYILVMFVAVYAVRVLPLTLIQKPINNRFVKSFLYYVPYVTLAVMTFPAIVDASGTVWVGILTLVAGIIAAWFGLGLFPVAAICCGIVFACSFIA